MNRHLNEKVWCLMEGDGVIFVERHLIPRPSVRPSVRVRRWFVIQRACTPRPTDATPRRIHSIRDHFASLSNVQPLPDFLPFFFCSACLPVPAFLALALDLPSCLPA